MKELEKMDKLKKDLFEAIDNICQHYAEDHKEPESKRFEIGRWVIQNKDCRPKLPSRVIEDLKFNYLIDDYCGKREEMALDNFARYCTPFEIESHLKKICDEKYPVGTKFKSVVTYGTCIAGGEYKYYPGDDQLTNNYGFTLYCKGKFAEIIPEKKNIPKTEKEFATFLLEWEERDKSINFLSNYNFKDE